MAILWETDSFLSCCNFPSGFSFIVLILYLLVNVCFLLKKRDVIFTPMTGPSADGTALPKHNAKRKAVAMTRHTQTPSGVFIQEVSKCYTCIKFNLNPNVQ